jgi:hypothetical protein
MSTEPHGMYFPSSQATVLVGRPDDADSTIFPKRITLLETTSQAVISPQRDCQTVDGGAELVCRLNLWRKKTNCVGLLSQPILSLRRWSRCPLTITSRPCYAKAYQPRLGQARTSADAAGRRFLSSQAFSFCTLRSCSHHCARA